MDRRVAAPVATFAAHGFGEYPAEIDRSGSFIRSHLLGYAFSSRPLRVTLQQLGKSFIDKLVKGNFWQPGSLTRGGARLWRLLRSPFLA